MPAFAAGTNEKNPDSYATGMTGTGSNAMDPNANDSRAVVVPRATYVTPAPGTTYVAPAPAGTVVAPAPAAAPVVGNIIAPSGTVAYAPAATVVYPYPVYNPPSVAVNHGAVGGQSAGKSSDSPGS
ncbi:MAG TPA: hypothetical protein VI321_01610 [Burkholderiales bacterium]